MSDFRHSLFAPEHSPDAKASAQPLRIGIVGGGISGLSAAYELTRIGYQVTVLERAADIGGMCSAISIDGRSYDLGGHLVSNSYHTMRSLLQELGLPIVPTGKAYFVSGDGDPQISSIFRQFEQAYTHFRRTKNEIFAGLSTPGLSHGGAALTMPASQWLRAHGAEELYELFAQMFAGAGYGFINEMDIPAVYFLKFIDAVDFLGDAMHSATVDGGLVALYRRLAEQAGDVRCGVEIERIERSACEARVVTKDETFSFDKIIIAMPLPAALPILDATAEEQALFSQIRTLDYYTTVCTVKNCPRRGLYFFSSHMNQRALGKPQAYYYPYDDTDICVFFSYGSAEIDGAAIVEQIKATVAEMGGEMVAVNHQRDWSYFPHVSSQAMQQGYYPRLEALQGQQNCWYLGSIFNFELMDCNIAYTRELVRQHFPSLNGQPARESVLALQPAPQLVQLTARVQSAAPSVKSAEAVQAQIVQLLASALQEAPQAVDVHRPMTEYGLDSLAFVEMLAQLAEWMGQPISASLVMEAPTIAALAVTLAGNPPAEPDTATRTQIARQPGWLAQHLISVFGRLLMQPFYMLALFAMGLVQLLIYQLRRVGELAPLDGYLGDLLYAWDSSLLEYDPYQWHTRRLDWFGGRHKMFLALNQVFVAGDYDQIKQLLVRPQRKTGDWLGYRQYKGTDFRLNSQLIINVSDGPHEQIRASIDSMLPNATDPAIQATANDLLTRWLDRIAAQTQQGLIEGFSAPNDLVPGYIWLLHRLICNIELTPQELANSSVYVADGIFLASQPARFVKNQPEALRPFIEHRRHLLQRYGKSAKVQALLAPFQGQFPEMDMLNGLFDAIHAAGVPGLALAAKAIIAEVTSRPDVYAVLQKEMRQQWDGQGVPPVSQLPLLHAAVLEAIRLYPPVWASSQMAQTNSENHVWGMRCPIKPKTQLTASIWLSGYDEKVFGSAPHKFNLHRDNTAILSWNDANPQRICPGKDLSLVITEMLMAQLLTHYTWKTVRTNGAPLVAANTTQFMLRQFARKTAVPTKVPPHAKAATAELSIAPPLDLGVNTASLPRGNWTNPGTIFVTGGSGFVGAYTIAALLHHTTATLHCLIRAKNVAEGQARLRRTLESYGLWSAEAARRVIAVPGDLAQPELGLEPAIAQWLAAEVDVIIHAGAQVNWFYSYSQLAPANVGGTRAILQLAARERLKAVHYISSLGIVFSADYASDQPIREDDDLERFKTQRLGYLQTKWAAETLIQAARRQGIPVTVYRPPYIASAGVEGQLAANTSFLLQSVRGSIKLGVFPDRLLRSDLVAVEFLGEAVARLIREPAAMNATLNMLNKVDWSTILAAVQDRGHAVRQVSTAEWLTAVLACGPENPLYPYKNELAITAAASFNQANSYDDQQTCLLLERAGLCAQPSAQDVINVYLDSLEAKATSPVHSGSSQGLLNQ